MAHGWVEGFCGGYILLSLPLVSCERELSWCFAALVSFRFVVAVDPRLKAQSSRPLIRDKKLTLPTKALGGSVAKKAFGNRTRGVRGGGLNWVF